MDNKIQLNVTALTRLISAALPGFLERSKGLIINIASVVALSPELLNGVYSGTKAFVVNLTQSLYNEVKDKGIQVQAVLPGATSTEFWDRAKLPIHNLPAEIVMSAEEMVDAAQPGRLEKVRGSSQGTRPQFVSNACSGSLRHQRLTS
jgi:hypothetical protein